jgi:uncharacterized protein YceK
MKLLLIIIVLALSGCASLPICKKDQTTNCRKIDAGDLGGTVRGYYEEIK